MGAGRGWSHWGTTGGAGGAGAGTGTARTRATAAGARVTTTFAVVADGPSFLAGRAGQTRDDTGDRSIQRGDSLDLPGLGRAAASPFAALAEPHPLEHALDRSRRRPRGGQSPGRLPLPPLGPPAFGP